MIQEPLPRWPEPETPQDDYTVSHDTLVRLGRGDAAAGRRFLRTLIDVESIREPHTGPVERPPTVRLANQGDEAGILRLLRLDHAENAAMVAPFDALHVKSFVEAATRERGATIGVIDGPDGVVAMVYLVPEVWWFCADWYVAERLLYVDPEHRRSRHAANLLDFSRSFVDAMSRDLGYRVFLVSSVVGTRDVDKKTALFGRMMTRAGGVFVYPTPVA
jgi:hypothetical protein